MYLNAGKLFRNAVEMCRAMPDVGGNEREALSSILLAVISCEAFINELAEIALPWKNDEKSPGWLKALGEMLDQAEQSRASIESKYHLAKFILTGEPFDTGALPFQDFALLINVRNILVHAKPLEAQLERNDRGEFIWTKPPLMRRLHSARIVTVDNVATDMVKNMKTDNLIADMVSEITKKPVALWACHTASATVNAVIDSVPKDSGLARLLNIGYLKDFQVL